MLTSFFQQYSQDVKDTLGLFPDIDDKLFIAKNIKQTDLQVGPLYSYGAIYYNISTPDGWAPTNLTLEMKQMLLDPIYIISSEERGCENFENSILNIQANNVIAYHGDCQFIEECNFIEIKRNANACLFKVGH